VTARLLFISNLFPTASEPYRGLDNATLLHALRKDFQIRVISPRPTLPWVRPTFSPRPEDRRLQPRWVPAGYVPRLGGPVNHLLMAEALREGFEVALREFRPDVILSSWIYPDSCAVLRLTHGRVPVVSIAQGSDVHQYLKMPARRRIIVDWLPRAAGVVTRSGELARLLEGASFPAGKLHTIYNGVSLEMFKPRDQAAARRECGLPEEARIILFVGNFYDVKNPLLLIEALSMLQERPILVMAGGGPLEADCRRLAAKLGIASRVIFAGRKSPLEIASLMNAADVLALPSRNEGVPNVILEAFASGLSVVASRVGGIPEVLDEKFLGRMVPPGEAPALATALTEQLAMESDPAAIRERGERYSWEAAAGKYREVLHAAVASKGDGQAPATILYHFRTRGTGAEAVHISGMVHAFGKLGHRVILSSPTGVDPREGAGATPFAEPASAGLLSRLSRSLPSGLFELLELLYNIPAFVQNLLLAQRHDCGLIYERHAFFLFSTALVARLRHCPLVVEVNELVGDARIRAQPMLAPLARWTDRFIFERARLIVVVSPHLKRRVEEYGIPPNRILVLPNAVSEEELAVPSDSSSAPSSFILQPSSISPHASSFLLGFAGWLVEWHRLDFVIEALAAPQFASVTLVLIGDGPLRSALEAQAEPLGVRLHFTGPLPHAEIPAILRTMDACVVPHSNEYRSPIKLFEFMAQARPVLAPRTEPIESVLRDGIEGLLFTPLDIDSFRAALEKLLFSKDLRESLGRSARRCIEENHTWEKNAARVLSGLG
jgi:glycosyltransferase involved in cell wall biosynthesis